MKRNTQPSIAGLIEIGLTEKEALLYQAALKCGPTTAQILSLESGVKRATTYDGIESLIKKGLLHTEINGVRKLFIASKPETLVTLLDQKKQILTTILPQLVQEYLHTASTSNAVKIYRGIPNIKLLYDQIIPSLNSGDEYFVISDQEKWIALDPQYFETFRKKRSVLSLKTQLILKESAHARIALHQQSEYQNTIKLLPQETDLNINMVILKNQSILTQLVEPYLSIQIENTHIAAMNRVLFGVIWDLLP